VPVAIMMLIGGLLIIYGTIFARVSPAPVRATVAPVAAASPMSPVPSSFSVLVLNRATATKTPGGGTDPR
jgi:hypothetical protein